MTQQQIDDLKSIAQETIDELDQVELVERPPTIVALKNAAQAVLDEVYEPE